MPEISNQEPTTITETFQELETRLDELTNERIHAGVWDHIRDNFSISKILRNIYRFDIGIGIKRIEAALRQINLLQTKGTDLLNDIFISGIDHENQFLYIHQFASYEDYPTVEQQKKTLFENIQRELNFYNKNLTILKAELEEEKKSKDSKNSSSPVYSIVIGNDFKFSQLRQAGDVILDKYQTALLFDYMRNNEIILGAYKNNNQALAKIVAALTGHSENNLRTEDGFGAIANIKSDKLKNIDKASIKSYNLITVKKALQVIIDQINTDIKDEN